MKPEVFEIDSSRISEKLDRTVVYFDLFRNMGDCELSTLKFEIY